MWAVRDELELKGTSLGAALDCVALMRPYRRRCPTLVHNHGCSGSGKDITTIEGLSETGEHPLQQAWVAVQTPQCGYCQSGQIMQAASLLATNAAPTDADIDEAMNGNLCGAWRIRELKKRSNSRQLGRLKLMSKHHSKK